MSYEDLQAAAAAIAERTGRDHHEAAAVLGSGLGSYASSFDNAIEIPYADIPHFPEPRVVGHGGSLFSAPVGDGAVLLFAGRVHTYEGWPLDEVVFGVRTAALAGARSVLLTNAAIEIDDLSEEPRCERSWKRDGTVKARSDGGMLTDRDADAVGV